MFKKQSHIDLMLISTIIFGFLLELFFFRPNVLALILGYLVIFVLILIHYDIHIHEKHLSPFKSAFKDFSDHNSVERFLFGSMHGFLNRVRHFYHRDNIYHHFHFLILPSFLYWSVMSLLFIFRDPWFAQTLIVFSTVSFMMVLASISSIYRKAFLIEERHLHLLSVIKVFIVFMAIMASYGYYQFGYANNYEASTLILASTLVLLYNYAWKTGNLFKKRMAWPAIFWSGVFTTFLCYLLQTTITNYFFAVVTIFAGYYLCFGIIKHYLRGDITKKIFLEYFIAALFLVGLVWANSYFADLII